MGITIKEWHLTNDASDLVCGRGWDATCGLLFRKTRVRLKHGSFYYKELTCPDCRVVLDDELERGIVRLEEDVVTGEINIVSTSRVLA